MRFFSVQFHFKGLRRGRRCLNHIPHYDNEHPSSHTAITPIRIFKDCAYFIGINDASPNTLKHSPPSLWTLSIVCSYKAHFPHFLERIAFLECKALSRSEERRVG